MIARAQVTGLVLAGGQGSRMEGRDKGLELFGPTPLALHAARRLAPQVHTMLISANRNRQRYAAFGWPVLPDGLPGYAGPLAGLMAGLQHCPSDWLACVPCDSPLFPEDLVTRLAQSACAQGTPLAVACAPEGPGLPVRRQPAFLLVQRQLAPSLEAFLGQGGRRIGAWLALHPCAELACGPPHDPVDAFANANTLDELRLLHGAKAVRDS